MSTTTSSVKKPATRTRRKGSAASQTKAKGNAQSPAKKAASKPHRADPVTTRKGQQGQVCTGCNKWKPLTEYGRTSKARGSKPMRRCTACIRAEAQARRAAKKEAQS